MNSQPPPRSRGRRGGKGRRRDDGGRGPQQRDAAKPRPADLPFRPSKGARPGAGSDRLRTPRLPRDHDVDLPRGVARELARHVKGEQREQQVVVAMSLAVDHADADRLVEAAELLEWVRQEAPRSATVRETLGIVRYRQGDFRAALRELQTYQRLTGRHDQNHLVADCHRALGHELDQIADAVTTMGETFPERQVEGLIVWASALADRGEPGAGAALLRKELDPELLRRAGVEAAARAAYVEGDLAERSGREDEAAAAFARVVELVGDDDAWDAPERLAALRDT